MFTNIWLQLAFSLILCVSIYFLFIYLAKKNHEVALEKLKEPNNGHIENKELSKTSIIILSLLGLSVLIYYGYHIIDNIDSIGIFLLSTLYIIWLIIKRPLIIIGLLLGIYGLVKFIKRCREH